MSLDPQVRMITLMSAAKPGMRIQKEESLQAWQEKARARLARLLGMDKLTPTEPDFRIEWTEDRGEYTETRFLFESEPQVTVCAELLLPKKASETKRFPLVIALQGHSTGMHISLGRPKYPRDVASISGGDRDFARQIIARDQAVLVIDQRGFGERGGTSEGTACTQPAVQAMLLGQTIIGQRCWDVSCALDVVLANYPQIDADRVAIMGNSGGGTTTIYAAALDQRIAAAMPSCALCGYQASIGEKHHCLCNYVPGIMNDFDMGDLAGLIAPRPLVVVNGTSDPSFPLFSAKEQVAVARQYYERANASDKLRHVIGAEGHRFYAADSWPVFDELTGWKD